MSFRHVFLSLLLALWPLYGLPQSYFFSHYDQEKGLMDLDINCMIQDKYGYLWAGTSGGLFRFDGNDFEEVQYFHNPLHDPVYDLMLDSRGKLWIAGENGITSYDGLSFSYFGVNTKDDSVKCFGLSEAANGNILFFYGERSVYQIEQGKPVEISQLLTTAGAPVVKVTGRNALNLKLLTSDDKIWQYTEDGFHEIMPADSSSGQILFATDGKIYKVTSEKLTRLDFHEGVFMEEGIVNIDDQMVQDVYSADNQTCWISYKNKIALIHKEQVKLLDTANGYDGGEVKSIFCDNENNIWLVTENKGLYCYHGDELMYLEYKEHMNFMPTSFCFNDKGQLLISYFGDGVDLYDDNEIYKIDQRRGLTSNYVRWITSKDNTCWIITARGVTLMQDGNFHSLTTSEGLPHNYAFNACSDDSARMWIATEGGIGIYQNNTFKKITTEQGLLSNRIKFMIKQKDGEMLLLSDHGIDKALNGKIERYIYQGLKTREVLNTMATDRYANVWIGSDINGLIFYNTSSRQVRYFNESRNMPFQRVTAMTFFKDNRLCLGTEKGMYYMKVSPIGDILTLSSIGIEKGYPDFEVIQNAMLKDADGIYAGTSIGVIKFYPDRMVHKQAIPVHITALNKEFRDTDWKNTKTTLDSWTGIPQNPRLAYDQNDLQINYKGISMKSRDKLWYRYQLVNYDENWSKPVRNESVLYANLSPGKYQFKVSASYDGLYWTDSYTQYDFIISPPFWKTWWFYILVTAFMLFSFVFINNYRIKSRVNQLLYMERLNKEEYERIQKKVAMDFHDEVGNHLTSISLLIELIKKGKWTIPKELKVLLNKIDTESKNLFLGTSDFIWSIDPRNNTLKEVFYKIKDYGDAIFDNTGIHFQVTNGVLADKDIILPAGFTRQIVLIFKEAINNAREHAGCTMVQFSVKTKPDNFLLKLSDNGTGFNAGEIEYYHGLKKMKLRGEKIKGDLIFNSIPDTGTEVILKADLNKKITN